MKWDKDKSAEHAALVIFVLTVVFVVFFNDAFRAVLGITFILVIGGFMFWLLGAPIFWIIALALDQFNISIDISERSLKFQASLMIATGFLTLVALSHITQGLGYGITFQTVFDYFIGQWVQLYDGEWKFGGGSGYGGGYGDNDSYRGWN